MKARLCFVELPAGRLPETQTFYAEIFGLDLTNFGPSYACTMTGQADLGLQGDAAEAPGAPLAVFEVENLEASLAAVKAGGGEITKAIFSFPGGRRFHFRDPSGNELAALQATAD